MIQSKEKKIDSIKKPVVVLESNAALAKKPEVQAQLVKVKGAVSKIESICNADVESVRSVGNQNRRTREAIIPLTLHAIQKINGHKISVGAVIPVEFIKQTLSTLKALKEKDFVALLTEVKEYVDDNKEALVALDYSTDEMDTFFLLLESYMDKYAYKENMKTAEVAREAMLDAEIAKADAAIKNLDILMDCFSHEYPETYSLYKANRKIKYVAGQPVSVLGSFTNAVTGAPAQSVIVKLYPLGSEDMPRAFSADQGVTESSSPVAVRKTTASGRFNVRNLGAGSYMAVISKAGYETQRIPIFVNPKETFRINVQIKKEEDV